MKSCSAFAFALFVALGSSVASAADPANQGDFGKGVYDSKCASCHGVSGKGDGPLAASLLKKPADLTAIAKKNNGVVPVMDLEAVIDGRAQTALHGPREMPVWGKELLTETGSDWPVYMGVPFNPEVFVRARILALIDYLARLQER